MIFLYCPSLSKILSRLSQTSQLTVVFTVLMKLILITCVNLFLLAHATKQYVATFNTDNTGISGSVTVDNGQFIIDLDLSNDDLRRNGFGGMNFTECTQDGLSYHIHQLWVYDDLNDRTASDCGPSYTSGHCM